MGKSNYPNKLDTSIEIPAVRDNIVEVGSDVLNSLRSAVFNIERALGVNPQGSTGNTVASRINRSLDGNGNILKEALDRAGLVSGPITNNDVSKTAGIEETKLNLNYPTSLLQDEISQLIKQIDTITKTLEELAYLYASHTHPEAKNRHKGQAITIDAIEALESSEGMITSETQTAQELFEKFFSSHINYDGTDISATNRSHEADQVYFDNADVSAFVSSNDVQGAIVDVLNQTSGQLVDHQNFQHSNGRLRTSNLEGEDATAGTLLVDEQLVTFIKASTEETDRILAISVPGKPDYPSAGIRKSDIARLYFGDSDSFQDFQIESFQLDGSNKIEIINVYGAVERNSHPLDSIKVFRNLNQITNPSGLLVTYRPSPSATNINLIQVANPDSAYVVSRGIRPSEISSDNRYMKILVDEQKEIILDVYDVSYEKQTIDTIIYKMNYKFAEEAANVLAYRVDFDHTDASEIAIVHNMPSSYGVDFSISIKRGTDDAIDSLGFSHTEDSVETGSKGSQFFIQGNSQTTFDLKLEQAGLSLLAGTSAIASYSVGIDFESYGISDGDILVIKNSDSDDGSYVITDVSSSTIEVDQNQLSPGGWSGESSESSLFYVLKTSLSLQSFNFLKEWDASNSGILDIFLDKNKNLFYNTRVEGAAIVYGASNTLVSLCDFEGDVSLYTESNPGEINLSLDIDNVPQISFEEGPVTSLGGLKNSYLRLWSGKRNVELTVYIEDSDIIFSKLDNDGLPFSIFFSGYSQVNLEENMLLGRVIFESAGARIVGVGGDVPRVFGKVQSGITSYKDLSTNAIDKVLQEPLLETRSNGVSRGLYLTPSATPIEDDHYVVDVTAGVCYVRGKRFEFEQIVGLRTDINTADADKVFIAINEWGELVFGGANSAGGTIVCSSPFNSDSHCILSCLEWDGVTVREIDLRLMVNNLDLKLLNSITVSPQPGMGHFQDLGSAIKYAKRFTDVFPNAGIPTIHLKSGVHKIVINAGVDKGGYVLKTDLPQAAYNAGIYLNFPVNIIGEGDSTVIDIATEFLDSGIENDDRTDSGDADHQGFLFIAGSGYSGVDGDLSVFDSGNISISDLKFRLTCVSIIDPRISNDDGHILNNFVSFKNVVFDYGEKVGSGHGIKFEQINSDSTLHEVGNLIVSDCSFIRANIDMSSHGDDLHKNILVKNNISLGNGSEGDLSILYHPLFSGINPHLFTSVPTGNNVQFINNILGGSHNNPHWAGRITSGGVWSNRIDSNLRLGRQLSIGGSGTISGDSDKGGYGLRLNTPTDSAVTKNGILVQEGNLDIDEGNIILEKGYIVVENENPGAYIRLETDSSSNHICSALELVKHTGSITLGENLGSVGFYGKESSTAYLCSEIRAEVETSSFNSSDRSTSIIMSTTEGYIKRDTFKINPDGSVHITPNSTAVNLSEVSGSLLIAGNVLGPEGTSHIAIDANDIQSKSDANTRGSLYLNRLGGNIYIGNDSDGESKFYVGWSDVNFDTTHFWTNSFNVDSSNTIDLISEDIDLRSEDIEIGTYQNHIRVTPSTLGDGGAAIQSEWASTAWPLHLQPETRVEIGSSSNDWSNVLLVKNTDTLAAGQHRPTANFQNHTIKSSQVHILRAEFPNIPRASLQAVNGSGSASAGNVFISMGGADNELAGYIASDGSGGVMLGNFAFTGSHPSVTTNREGLIQGMIMSSTGKVWTTNVSGISTGIPKLEASSVKNDSKVYGVLSDVIEEGSILYEGHFDKHGVLDNELRIAVNSLGEGKVLVSDINGELSNGDYITSSEIVGYGMRQDDDILRSCTVAKCVEDIDWSRVNETEINGIRCKVYLAACTYHCG